MEDLKVNREYKSSIFAILFGSEEYKQNILDLYNALADTNHTNLDELEYTTLEDAIYISVKNDVSFLIDGNMALFEHQSTYNPNMPLRGLIYFSHLYQSYIEKCEDSIYGSKLIKIPTPQYYVFYNGEDRKVADKKVLKLSDAFLHEDKSNGFEWTATMLNINIGHNKKFLEKCHILWEYSTFIHLARTYSEELNDVNAGVQKAIDECISKNILKDFLIEKQSEVIAMCLFKFDKEKYEDTLKREGERKGEFKALIELVKKGLLSLQQASDQMGMSLEKFEKEAKNLALL
jgi:predicted HTH domain antitoxin